MVKEVVMPRLGIIMKTGTISKWLKKEGEKVEQGEPLFVMETEKFTEEVNAPASGILCKILAPEKSVVPHSKTIAIIAEPGEELPDIDKIALEVHTVVPSPAKERVEEVEEPRESSRVSPVARKLAEEHGIDVKTIRGSGPGGRIVKEDVLRAIEQVAAVAPTVPEPAKVAKVIPMTAMRRTVAEHMSHSHLTAAHVTITMEVDMSEVAKLREAILPKIEKASGVRVSFTDILVWVVARILREYPLMNSTLEDGQIKIFEDIHIGVATALEEGLIVPVVRNADKKSLAEIARIVKELSEKARQSTISLDEMTGSTFTITNLGMFGVETFTPIINPPEVAILGVGRMCERPVVVNGQIAIRPMMPLSLSIDHRVVDGAPASRFLGKVKETLERPPSLFL